MTVTTRVVSGTRMDNDMRKAINKWQNRVVALDGVDAVTTELVRLRAAKHHDCHT